MGGDRLPGLILAEDPLLHQLVPVQVRHSAPLVYDGVQAWVGEGRVIQLIVAPPTEANLKKSQNANLLICVKSYAASKHCHC